MDPLLILETSSRRSSMLLRHAGRILECVYPSGRTLTSFLADAPGRLLRFFGLPADSIRSVAAGVGPGSYTGLRCGAAFAQALAAAMPRARVAGVPSLLGWALQSAADFKLNGCLIMTANAFQGDVYLRSVRIEDSRPLEPGKDEVVASHELAGRVREECEAGRGSVTVLGFGCEIVEDAGISGEIRLVRDAGFPSARGILLAVEALGMDAFLSETGEIRPAYLRPSAAAMKKNRNS